MPMFPRKDVVVVNRGLLVAALRCVCRSTELQPRSDKNCVPIFKREK